MDRLLFLSFIFFICLTWFLVGLIVYFMPTTVAFVRKHKNVYAIAILNTVLGWTFFGWLAALLWGLNGDVQKQEN